MLKEVVDIQFLLGIVLQKIVGRLIAEKALPPGQLAPLLATPVYLPLVGVYERIMTMIIQIGLSIVVLESIRRSDKRYLLAAVGLHTLLNFLAVSAAGYGVIVSEMMVTVFAIGLGYWTYNRLKDVGIKTGGIS